MKTYRQLSRTFGLIACLLIVNSSSCFLVTRERPGGNEYRELTENKWPDNTVMIRRFEQYPVDKQIDIFLYSEDPRFEPILALGGEKVVAPIVKRIETEHRVWDKVRLIGVLERVDAQCKCVTSNSEIVTRLDSVSQELDHNDNISSDDPYKRMYKSSLKNLEEGAQH